MGRKLKEPREPYGRWLRQLRIEKGLTQKELATIITKSMRRAFRQTTISEWETTGKLPHRLEIVALANALEISLEELLTIERNANGSYTNPLEFEDAIASENSPKHAQGTPKKT